MKNLGIKTKKFVRKITAIASAALLSGVGMSAGLADLTSLSDNFITSGEFDAYVALGTQGATNVEGFAKDVAGSIVVAAAFAQQATTTTSSSGSATLTRNLTTGYLSNQKVGINSAVPTSNKVWKNSDSGFSWLPNSTVQNSSDDVANVTATLTAKAANFELAKEGVYYIYDGALVYNLTFNSKNDEITGTRAIGNNTKNIPFPDGKMYQITNWTKVSSDINITLGDYTEVSATTGEVYSIGDTGATFEITQYSAAGSSSSAALKIKVLDADGTQLFHDYVSSGEVVSNDDFDLRLSEFYVPGGVVDASMEWSTSSTKLVNGKENANWPNWTIRLTTDATPTGITSIAWELNLEEGTPSYEMDSEVSYFDGLFKAKLEDLYINTTDELVTQITVKDADGATADLLFKDEANDTTQMIDLNMKTGDFNDAGEANINSWLNSYTWKIKCLGDGSGGIAAANISPIGVTGANLVDITPLSFNLNGTHGNLTEYNVTAEIDLASATTSTDCTSYNLTISALQSETTHPVNRSLTYALDGAGHATYMTNASSSSVNGTVTLTEENTSKTVNVYLKSGSIDRVVMEGTERAKTTGSSYYTEYGTKVNREATQVSIYYPEAQRYGKISVGQEGTKDYVLSDGEYSEDLDVTLASGSGSSIAINSIDVGLAKLDSELTGSSLSKPIILVGGWAVNSLVNDLVTAGEVSSSDISVAGEALVQLIEGSATMNNQDVLVIAGWTGDDTRLAAQLVASEVLTENFGVLSGSKTILNTGVTSVSDVTSK